MNVKLSAAVKNTYMRGLVRLAKWFDSIGLRISSALEADLHRTWWRLKGRLFSTTGAAAFESRETTQGEPSCSVPTDCALVCLLVTGPPGFRKVGTRRRRHFSQMSSGPQMLLNIQPCCCDLFQTQSQYDWPAMKKQVEVHPPGRRFVRKRELREGTRAKRD